MYHVHSVVIYVCSIGKLSLCVVEVIHLEHAVEAFKYFSVHYIGIDFESCMDSARICFTIFTYCIGNVNTCAVFVNSSIGFSDLSITNSEIMIVKHLRHIIELT